ncbi:trans-sialidase, putative, partial [Trypanosoma cruzi marinkellei]
RKGGEAKSVGSGFIKATIGGDGDDKKRDVMLVTLPVYPEKDDETRTCKLHLWLTDNTHIVDIGPVSGKGGNVTASSLLYKSDNGVEGETDDNKEELFALYEKKGGEGKPSPDMVSVRLTAELQRVKKVLKTWKEVDERVSSLCPTLLSVKGTSAPTACSVGKITDGLVGFLSGNFSDNTWGDEYLGVDATVNKDDEAKEAA